MPGKPVMDRPLCRATTKAGQPCAKRAAAGSAFCGVHGGATRKIGAPSKLTRDLVARIAEEVALASPYEAVALAAGVHRSTLRQWREKGTADLAAGKDTVYAFLVAELTRAQAEAEVRLVELVRRHGVVDWRAAAWMLERRHPERYAAKRYAPTELDVDEQGVEAARPREVTVQGPKREAIEALLRDVVAPPAETGA